jgi:hypothetical protein
MSIHELARRVTETYLRESRERFDAADRAALARKLIEKSGSAEALQQFYSDPQMALAAEFLETVGDNPSFEALFEFMERKSKERGGTK